MSFLSAAARRRLLPILLGQGIGIACGLLGIKLTARLVPPAVLGAYGIFLTFTSVGTGVIYAGLIKYVGRHWAAASDRASLLRVVAQAARRKLFWLLPACIPAAVFVDAHRWPAVLPLLFVTVVLLAIAALAQTALQAVQAHWRDLAVTAAGAVIRSFAPPLLYTAAGGAVLLLYTGYGLHAFVLAAVGAWFWREYWRPSASGAIAAPPEPLGQAYEGPLFIVLALTGWILLGLNRWIVAWFFGSTQTGYFSLASSLATLIPSILGTILLLYFQPGFFAAASETPAEREQLARRVDQVALLHLALALGGLLALNAVAPLLVGPLLAETYRPALALLLPAGCFTLAVTTGFFYHALLLAGKREPACGPTELTAAGILVAGGALAAAVGETWFLRWLLATPAVPWLVNRTLARRYFFRPAAPARA
jgi:hypothetical protein